MEKQTCITLLDPVCPSFNEPYNPYIKCCHKTLKVSKEPWSIETVGGVMFYPQCFCPQFYLDAPLIV